MNGIAFPVRHRAASTEAGRLARGGACIYLATACWTIARFADVTVFDLLSALLLPVLAIVALQHGRASGERRFAWAILASSLAMVLAVAASAVVASAPGQHLVRGMSIVLGLGVTGIDLYLLYAVGLIDVRRSAWTLSLAGAASSLVGIVQGRFGALTWLIPQLDDGWQPWSRATGLAEHPIEAGLVTGSSIVLALALMLSTRRQDRSALLLAIVAIDLWSLQYTASLSAAIAIAVAVVAQLIVSRRFALAGGAAAAGVATLALAVRFGSGDAGGGGLVGRLAELLRVGTGYATAQSRGDQIAMAIDRLTPVTMLTGRGYDPADLPTGLDIHNGLVAADYHFGLLGVAAQLILIGFCLWRALRFRSPTLRAAALALLVVFLSAYLTGPSLSRRSVWVPMLALAAVPAGMPIGRTGRYTRS